MQMFLNTTIQPNKQQKSLSSFVQFDISADVNRTLPSVKKLGLWFGYKALEWLFKYY